jgi:hypothetical protein
MGRSNTYTPQRVELILSGVKLGLPLTNIAAFAGVNAKSFYGWRSRCLQHFEENRTTKQAAIGERLHKAEADRIAASLLRIARAGEGGQVIENVVKTTTAPDGTQTTETRQKVTAPDWKADAWFLEHAPSTKQAYSAQQRTELTGAAGGPVKLNWLELMSRAEEQAKKDDSNG